MDEDEGEVLRLPEDTLQLLQQFQAEKDVRARQFESLKHGAENAFQNGSNSKVSMDMFVEDWNESQFWYSDDTASTLAQQLLAGAGQDTAIAVVSAPSVYIQLRNILSDDSVRNSVKPKIYLLEHDKRFEVLGSDFIYYDFNHPRSLPADLQGKFDRIICDPPFLSEDCQTKTALTVRYLAREWTHDGVRFITCTGERMQPVIAKLYGKLGVRSTTFEPKHSRGLSNEFRCYANFEGNPWKYSESEGGDASTSSSQGRT